MAWVLANKQDGTAPEIPLEYDKWLYFKWFITMELPIVVGGGDEYKASKGGRVWHVNQFMYKEDLNWLADYHDGAMPYLYPLHEYDVKFEFVGLDNKTMPIYTLKEDVLIVPLSFDEAVEFIKYVEWVAELHETHEFMFVDTYTDGGTDDWHGEGEDVEMADIGEQE